MWIAGSSGAGGVCDARVTDFSFRSTVGDATSVYSLTKMSREFMLLVLTLSYWDGQSIVGMVKLVPKWHPRLRISISTLTSHWSIRCISSYGLSSFRTCLDVTGAKTLFSYLLFSPSVHFSFDYHFYKW
jgi:hypothetical protein